MTQQNQQGAQSHTQSQKKPMITAKKAQLIPKRIAQGDIFPDIEIIESLSVVNSEIKIERIKFPFVVCLNQECELERDFENTNYTGKPSESRLIHLIVAPAHLFEHYLEGNHWGELFKPIKSQKRKDTKVSLIMRNEIPRYHYLKFQEDYIPELIIDFKHYFTVNRDSLYSSMSMRICSIDDLFKEKISQRFSYFISRIGLPEIFEG